MTDNKCSFVTNYLIRLYNNHMIAKVNWRILDSKVVSTKCVNILEICTK